MNKHFTQKLVDLQSNAPDDFLKEVIEKPKIVQWMINRATRGENDFFVDTIDNDMCHRVRTYLQQSQSRWRGFYVHEYEQYRYDEDGNYTEKVCHLRYQINPDGKKGLNN